MAPHTAGLAAAEGGFETPLGWFGVRWALAKTAGSRRVFILELQSPRGTTGTVLLPFGGQATVDGKVAAVPSDQLLQIDGGTHVISAKSWS